MREPVGSWQSALAVWVKQLLVASGSANSPRCLEKQIMRYVGLLLCTLPLLGQNVRVSSGTASPGRKITIEIVLDSPAGKEPLAMQWEVAFPDRALMLEANGPTAGAAAQAAGKNLTCIARKKPPGVSTWACVLAGGQKGIGNGPLAMLRFEVRPNAATGSELIVVDKILGVSAAVKKVPLARAEGAVKVVRGPR
jgi:hypothetical protein